MKASLRLHLLLLAALGAAASLQGQGTAFTYQGRLNQNGGPATGIYDLRFTIYDTGGGATVIAGPLNQNSIGVTNGLFTTALDFGANVFTGPGRWLEIGVRTNGGPVFSNLSPRQPLLPAPYAIHSGTASNMANGAVVRSVNGLKDDMTLAAGANVTITPSGNTLTIASTAGGVGETNSLWSRNGANAYYNAGNVGIGTTSPGAVLEIRAPNFNIHQRITDSSSGNSLVLQAGSGNNMKVTGYNYGTASAVPLFLSVDGANTILNSGGGNVGIGTTTPLSKLHLFDPVDSVTHVLQSGGGVNAWAKVAFNNPNGQWDIATSRSFNNDVLYIDRLGNGSLEFQLSTTGLLGLGIEPQSKLHLYEPDNSVSQRIQTGGGVNAWTRLELINANGQWDIGTSRSFNNDVFYIDRNGNSALEFQLSTTGLLGLGIEPQAKLHLYEPNNSVSHRIETGGGVNAWSRTEYANANGQWITGTSRGFNGDQFYIYRAGAPAIAFGLQPNGDAYLQGTMSCKVLTITGGADIAEPFQMSSDEIPKGSVVVIDEANPGHLKLSTEAYDTRVAGIVSGANGIKPGISLHQEGALEGGENVALSGRVYVHADATNGAIKPGDLLTTSATPGHAMKVGDHAKAQGAILGKAMTGLKDGKGMVLVLVTLQ
jgi:hypothetical protein